MNELLMIVLFFLFDFAVTVSGVNFYTLLLVPPYLFSRNYSPAVILFGGGIAVLFSEILHQHTLGSFMLGVGIALFVFNWFLDVINWQHLWPQAVCLFLYFCVVASVRILLIRLAQGLWTYPPFIPFLLTYVIGLGLIIYRFNRSTQTTSRSTTNDAI